MGGILLLRQMEMISMTVNRVISHRMIGINGGNKWRQ